MAFAESSAWEVVLLMAYEHPFSKELEGRDGGVIILASFQNIPRAIGVLSHVLILRNKS